jgi:hypothetical protein
MMRNSEDHLSDAELLRLVDGELSGSDRSGVEAHLTACWQCRSRRTTLDRSISDYMQIHVRPVELPPIDEARALLLVQLMERAATRPAPVTRSNWISRRMAYGGAAASLIFVVSIVLYFSVRRIDAASIPDGHLTPGATRSVTKEDLCSSSPQGFYPISANLASSVFEKYRIQNPRPRSYEVDYLITPGLGGPTTSAISGHSLTGPVNGMLMSKTLWRIISTISSAKTHWISRRHSTTSRRIG